jgi:energy-coupling factor transporter ATP-binding protein EcfA2
MVEQEITIRNPFPGLRTFEVNESLIFFGRDGLSDAVLKKLRAERFVAVVGTSGSGKSSLVRAGLLPALRGGFMKGAGSGWRIALFRPVNNPIGNLARALSKSALSPSDEKQLPLAAIEETLRRTSLGLIEVVRQLRMAPDEKLLIVVDQFEELYRFEPSSEVENPKEEAAAFVKLLLEATKQADPTLEATKQADPTLEAKKQTDLPIYVIVTMRSDYLGESARFSGLPEAINRGQYLIPRMDDDERREAIEGPVRVFGAKISSPLVNRLLNDAGDDPTQLPILQHALMRTWDYWVKNGKEPASLGIKQYDNPEVGGMERALSLHADEAYDELSDAQKIIAQKMFKRLTEKGVDAREGRLPATVGELKEITGSEEVVTVIETFRKEGRSFLMPPAPPPPPPGEALPPLPDDTLIDISHESLIRGWDRLKAWVEEEADSAKIYLRIVDDALRYPKKTGLLTDPELQLALDWREKQQPNEVWAKRYMTEFGKALTGKQPPPLPEWADTKATEFGIANKYLDMSRDARDHAAALKEKKQRVTLITLAGVAAVFLALFVIALLYYRAAANATKVAVEAQDQAITSRDEARRAFQDAEVQRGNALVAQTEANSAKITAEAAKIMAETRERDAIEAKRGLNAALIMARGERTKALYQAYIARQRKKELTAFGRLGEATNKLINALAQNNRPRAEKNTKALIEAYQAMHKFYEEPKFINASNQGILNLLTGQAILKDRGMKVDDAFGYIEKYETSLLSLLEISGLQPRNLPASINLAFAKEILEFEERDKTEAIKYFRKGIAALNDSREKEEKADALVALGDISEPLEAGRAYYDAKALYQAKGMTAREAAVLEKIGVVWEALDEIEKAEAVYEESVKLFSDVQQQGEAARVLNKLGDLFKPSDELKAIELFRRASVAYQAAGDNIGKGNVLRKNGDLYRRLKDNEKALNAYEDAHNAFVAGGISRSRDKSAHFNNGWVLEIAATIYMARNETAKAISKLNLAAESYKKAEYGIGVTRANDRIKSIPKVQTELAPR